MSCVFNNFEGSSLDQINITKNRLEYDRKFLHQQTFKLEYCHSNIALRGVWLKYLNITKLHGTITDLIYTIVGSALLRD